ncbi:histamine N-methyltransferase A-like [Latimeria chalumnae]|uniref:Histamine N-methyltransferase n=1 Tax=Latimeria chalumnae TaxID=7897 RepID=H3AJD6_LATCH|nr:PREDICTED: histamine N-methyltransferase A-like [Latimeria chalumnae]|eukprot:XP_005997744.1 PREDICTED: histamine N-methyltransferase A-like [Latimeria chalumnae]
MASSMKSLAADPSRYAQVYPVFLSKTNDSQILETFLDEKFTEYVNSFATEKEAIKILGVGSGTGKADLIILKTIQKLYPEVPVIYEVLEPNKKHIIKFKAAISSTPNLKNVTFVWSQQTCEEYEKKVKDEKECKKFDFIHMIHMLYYVKDVASTIGFFRRCLEKTGKLIISIMKGSSGYTVFWNKYGVRLGLSDYNVSSDQVIATLEEQDISYQNIELENELDITDCFKGNETGNLLIDFLTHTCNFNETAPTDLKTEIVEYLRTSEYTSEIGGKIILENKLAVIMVDP